MRLIDEKFHDDDDDDNYDKDRGIPPQIIVIYTTMSPILFIFGPKVPPQVVFKNPKNFWPRTPRGPDMAI